METTELLRLLRFAAYGTVLTVLFYHALGGRYTRFREGVVCIVVTFLFAVALHLTVFPTTSGRDDAIPRVMRDVPFESFGAAAVVKYEPNPETGGVLTLRDYWGGDRKIDIAELRTQIVPSQGDPVLQLGVTRKEIHMWYWDGTNPADGRMVVIRPS